MVALYPAGTPVTVTTVIHGGARGVIRRGRHGHKRACRGRERRGDQGQRGNDEHGECRNGLAEHGPFHGTFLFFLLDATADHWR